MSALGLKRCFQVDLAPDSSWELDTRFTSFILGDLGADYGSSAVDGSSFLSELDPEGRSEKGVLHNSFLRGL